ncbi:MAG: hydantoinase/oxoprolinase family protein [Candidatus Odinarchaeota archaeon]|nr:hydantoinase/oxoprolinase family protein [Candidatus Odinarchaeota archaeon]
MSLAISFDIGGTFTDIILFDRASGHILKEIKVPSTPQAPEKAIQAVLATNLTEEEKTKISHVFHATTIATNALLGQIHLELPKTFLLTTKGFRDIIEIGRQRRPVLYDLFFEKPKPIIPRRYRFEIEERLNHNGEILIPLNMGDLEKISQVIAQEKPKSVAISLLHSYSNPIHEVKIKEYLLKKHPELYVSLSSEISPEHREYERTSTTAVNAVLMPIVSRYLSSLEKIFKDAGINAPIFIMQSNGGVGKSSFIKKAPVSIIESGPSAGVVATQFIAKLLKIPHALSFDMGGTTAKAGTVINFEISLTAEYEVGGAVHSGRITKGGGYPIRFPFIDLAEISSGGGSIAWIDEGGALRVGPISAGADPGPACYGKGGENPTITDANLVLGRLNPKGLLNETFKVCPNLARQAIHEKICMNTGLSLTEATFGIIKIANTNMSRILRIVTIERGHDPRKFSMIAYGGAGPMHACALAEDLGIKRVVVPPLPGLFSAMGLLLTDIRHSFVKSIRKEIKSLSPTYLEKNFLELEERGASILKEEGCSAESIVHTRFVEMRYKGQGFELMIPVTSKDIEIGSHMLVKKFEDKHKALYGYVMVNENIELINIRVNSTGILKKPVLQRISQGENENPEKAIKEYRDVFFEYFGDYEKTPIFDRTKLKAGHVVIGPAIIEQYDSTTVIPPRWEATVDKYGVLLLKRV